MANDNLRTLTHPALGNLTGCKHDNLPVIQFLGVKYASIEQRFSDSRVFEGATENATRFGNICPQVPNSLKIEQAFLIQKELLSQGALPEPLETECLNLNISVPENFKPAKKLPVLVWIHGGGFLFGASSWPHTDMAKLVSLGQAEGSPFIGVSLNYRTGIFSFLSLSEMKSFGSHGNYGIKDQINAFLWVQKFIAGFGGDPDNVTAIGESCGGVSVSLLLHHPKPLFQQLISMGGHALLMGPIPLQTADAYYGEVIKLLGLTDLTPADRLDRLRSVAPEDIIAKVPMSIPNRPVVDGIIFRSLLLSTDVQDPTNQSSNPGKAWCSEIMIGDCQADGYIMSSSLQGRKDGLARQFIDSMTRSLHGQPELVASIVSDYQLSDDDSGEEAFHKIVAFITDIGFYKPTTLALRGWPRPDKRYLYHFNAANPFPGPLNGKASHILDIAYLFQNYNEFLSERDVAVAKDFARAIIAFTRDGSASWQPWSEQAVENYGVFGETSPGTTFGVEGRGQRRPYCLKEGYDFDLLWAAVQKFLGGQ